MKLPVATSMLVLGSSPLALPLNFSGSAANIVLPKLETVAPATSSKGANFYQVKVGSTSQFEIAPAGTYMALYSMIEQLKKRDANVVAPWMDTAISETSRLDMVPQDARDLAVDVIRVCSRVSVSEPSIADDDEGGIELFFKERNSALLLAINAGGDLQIFGDSKKEQWRSRYSLKGAAWKRHLTQFISDLSIDDD